MGYVPTKKCVYVLGGPKPEPFYQCAAPTKYVMKLDDDGNKYRWYDYLCPKHRAKVNEQGEISEEN